MEPSIKVDTRNLRAETWFQSDEESRHALGLHTPNPFVDRAIAMERLHESIDAGRRFKPPSVSKLTLFLWILFGASGWWSSNVIFAELPLFVAQLPAGEKLGNQLSLMTQLGNIFLIAYKILDYHCQFRSADVIQVMMGMAVLSLLACANCWDHLIDGRSMPLLVVMGVAGGVGCLSNATYWSLMISYPAVCTKACSIGMSLGGVFTTWLAAAQLAGRPDKSPRFTARAYFSVAAALQCILWLVVMVLDGKLTRCLHAWGGRSAELAQNLLPRPVQTFRTNSDPSEVVTPDKLVLGVLLFCSFLVHAMTYTVPSLMPFVASACSEHESDDRAQQILLWMLVCQQAGETSGRMLAPVGRAKILLPALTTIYFVVVFVIFFAITTQPHLMGNTVGCNVAMPVLPMMCFGYFCSFGVMQTFLFLSARRLASETADKELLASQMGSLTTNVVAFAALNLD